MTNEDRWTVYNALLERSVNGQLKKTTTKEVSDLLSVPLQTVQSIWRRAKNTSHKRIGNCGRKRKQIDLGQVSHVPLNRRTTIRSLAVALDVNSTSVFRAVKYGYSNAIKPQLNEGNMKDRPQFCLSMLNNSILPHQPKFVDMYNVVHDPQSYFAGPSYLSSSGYAWMNLRSFLLHFLQAT